MRNEDEETRRELGIETQKMQRETEGKRETERIAAQYQR